METKNEVWKDVEGYEGLYQVSNFGRLKSFKVNNEPRILKNTNKKGWYFTIVLQGKNKPTKTDRIHRLVAKLFLENPNNYPEVNHKDMNKQNNAVSNLEWVSRKQNVSHAVKNKPSMIIGMNHYNKFIKTTPIIQKTIDGVFIETFINAKEASDKTKVCHRNILQVAHKTEYRPGLTRKQAGGFIWELK